MTEHPEARGADLISPAVQSILISQFRDQLEHGNREHTDGTAAGYDRPRAARLAYLKAEAAEGRMTWTDLFLAQAFEIASSVDPSDLRVVLTGTGATIVQWIESLDRRYGGV